MPISASLDLRTAAVNRFCEFLVVATHAILYMHQVYPSRMFEQRRKYGVATHYGKHPTVNSYITRVVTALRPWALAGSLTSVTIPVFSAGTNHVHARYVFEPVVLAPRGSAALAAPLAALDAQLRAHLLRLLATAEVKQSQGDELQFDFIVRTEGIQVGPEWVPADGDERREFSDAQAVPLKDCDSSAHAMQLSSRAEFPFASESG